MSGKPLIEHPRIFLSSKLPQHLMKTPQQCLFEKMGQRLPHDHMFNLVTFFYYNKGNKLSFVSLLAMIDTALGQQFGGGDREDSLVLLYLLMTGDAVRVFGNGPLPFSFLEICDILGLEDFTKIVSTLTVESGPSIELSEGVADAVERMAKAAEKEGEQE